VTVRRCIRIERRTYSRAPWRLVDSLTGEELSFPVVFDHPDLGPSTIYLGGFDTKAEALERLGELAAHTLRDRTEPCS
jgi:hypothetical protein